MDDDMVRKLESQDGLEVHTYFSVLCTCVHIYAYTSMVHICVYSYNGNVGTHTYMYSICIRMYRHNLYVYRL